MLVLMSQSYLVLFVVVVIVSSLLSLLIVDSYLLVTGTVFLKQIEVCNVGENFVHMWRICFFVVGALFVGFVWFSFGSSYFPFRCFFVLCFFCSA